MSDTIKLIREAIETRLEALPDGFTKLDNKFNLEKNHFNNGAKRFGVMAQEGSNANFLLGSITTDRTFEITLCNKFQSTVNGDDNQEIVGDLLESIMEDAIVDLSQSKLGLSSIVLDSNYTDNNEIEYQEVANLAILRFNIVVKYRKGIC